MPVTREQAEETLAALEKHGSVSAWAKAEGKPRTTLRDRRDRARQILSQPHDGEAHNIGTKGTSIHRRADGSIISYWEKNEARKGQQKQALADAAKALSENIRTAKPTKAPKVTQEALCNLYTLTDCHVGMLAWHREGGDDWDLPISLEVLTGAFDLMVKNSPKAKVGIVNQLGDFLHYDGLIPVTPANRHVLDADGRFTKMAEYSVQILRAIIDTALKHHEQVHVILAEGNHDEASSAWLRIMFQALYENEPRVTVDDSVLPFYVYEHGKTMLAFHHGHKVAKGKMQGLFAAQFPKVWGNTEHRYAHCGHYHHIDVKEDAGMVVEQHPTLAARDAYAARGGWISARGAVGVTYHKEFGEVGRTTIRPEMLK